MCLNTQAVLPTIKGCLFNSRQSGKLDPCHTKPISDTSDFSRRKYAKMATNRLMLQTFRFIIKKFKLAGDAPVYGDIHYQLHHGFINTIVEFQGFPFGCDPIMITKRADKFRLHCLQIRFRSSCVHFSFALFRVGYAINCSLFQYQRRGLFPAPFPDFFRAVIFRGAPATAAGPSFPGPPGSGDADGHRSLTTHEWHFGVRATQV